MFKGLSLDQAPPFEAPIRFFLTAPIFAVLAGFSIFFSSGFADINSPESLAVLHFFTIGFMSMVMIGAMQQMLPVLVGVRFPNPLVFATVIHIFLTLATLMFWIGFYSNEGDYLLGASVFLIFGMGLFAGVTLYKLFSASFKSESVVAMRLSLISLLMALMFGVYMLLGIGTASVGGEFEKVLKIHGVFAFFGWVGLLIIGVSYQVIPMFYVTPDFDKKAKKYLSYAVFGALFLFVIGEIFGFDWFLIVILGLFVYFGILSLLLIERRKRKIVDVTINYWRVSSISLIIGSILFAVNIFYHSYLLSWFVTVILGYGFVISLINGMLYKIVPFLSWFHISSRGFFDMPTMKEMIKSKDEKNQFILHMLSFIGLLLLGFFSLEKITGILIVLSNIYLLYNLFQAFKVYLEYKDKKSPFDISK